MRSACTSVLSCSCCRVRIQCSHCLFSSGRRCAFLRSKETGRSTQKTRGNGDWPQHTLHVPDSRTSSPLATAVPLILSVIFRTKVRSYFSATIYDLVRRESERASERTGTDCVLCAVRVCCAPKSLEFKFECCRRCLSRYMRHTQICDNSRISGYLMRAKSVATF